LPQGLSEIIVPGSPFGLSAGDAERLSQLSFGDQIMAMQSGYYVGPREYQPGDIIGLGPTTQAYYVGLDPVATIAAQQGLVMMSAMVATSVYGAGGGAAAARGTAATVPAGTRVFRVWGGQSLASGRSWTRVDPRTVPNYRNVAGLPSTNTGRYLSTGRLTDTAGVEARNALSLDGNLGGLDEVVVPNVPRQILLESTVPLRPRP
jgi:hypothetical protein